MGGIFEFLSPPSQQDHRYLFLLHVLTCNSNKQQEVEDRVLDIISFLLQLSLRSSGFHNITITKRNTMLASIVLLSAVGTASSLGTTNTSFLMLITHEIKSHIFTYTSATSQPLARSTESPSLVVGHQALAQQRHSPETPTLNAFFSRERWTTPNRAAVPSQCAWWRSSTFHHPSSIAR